MEFVYQQFPYREKKESSFQGLCAKELNLDRHRFLSEEKNMKGIVMIK
jgi:hypothetical protein